MPETPEPDEDDLGIVFPSKPSELRQISDEELSRVLRKTGYANKWPFSSMAEFEMSGRLIFALKEFKAAADRSSRTLNRLTLVLVVLTVVLVVYAVRAG